MLRGSGDGDALPHHPQHAPASAVCVLGTIEPGAQPRWRQGSACDVRASRTPSSSLCFSSYGPSSTQVKEACEDAVNDAIAGIWAANRARCPSPRGAVRRRERLVLPDWDPIPYL